MKIFRALGLLVFLLAIHFMLTDVYEAFSDSLVALFNMIEQAAHVSEMNFKSFR